MYGKQYEAIFRNLNNSLMQHFYSVLYNSGTSIANSEGTPDISGYSLIFLVPPILSGLGMGFSNSPSGIITSRNSIFQALEFSPPDVSINTDDISSSSRVKIPFVIGKTSGGQMSISYIENMRLDAYAFHNNWFHYMEQVALGYMDPAEEYLESGELDYATSAFVMRFKPDMKSMVYLGKAVGIFPINLPSKDIIGSRQSVQLTTINVSYACADYREIALIGNDFTVSKTYVDNMWIFSDFISAIGIMFPSMDLLDIGKAILHDLNIPLISMGLSESSGTTF